MRRDDALVAITVMVVVGALAAGGKLGAEAVERIVTLLIGYSLGRGKQSSTSTVDTGPATK